MTRTGSTGDHGCSRIETGTRVTPLWIRWALGATASCRHSHTHPDAPAARNCLVEWATRWRWTMASKFSYISDTAGQAGAGQSVEVEEALGEHEH